MIRQVSNYLQFFKSCSAYAALGLCKKHSHHKATVPTAHLSGYCYVCGNKRSTGVLCSAMSQKQVMGGGRRVRVCGPAHPSRLSAPQQAPSVYALRAPLFLLFVYVVQKRTERVSNSGCVRAVRRAATRLPHSISTPYPFLPLTILLRPTLRE